jgi:hypothetical protein
MVFFLTRTSVKSMMFLVAMLCSSEQAWHLGGTYCLCLQGQRLSQARNQQQLGSIYDPEDGGNILLQIIGISPN